MNYDISEVSKELNTLLDWTWWELKIISDHLMTDPYIYNEEDYCQFKEDFFELSVMLNNLEGILGKKYTPKDAEDRPWQQQKHYKALEELLNDA